MGGLAIFAQEIFLWCQKNCLSNLTKHHAINELKPNN